MSDIDYDSIDIDESKSRAEYHYTERRSDILTRIREAGHPRAFTQRDLAEDYDCSVSTINSDMQALAEFIDGTLGNRRPFVSDLVFQKAIRELIDEGEWRDAARTVKEWGEFVDEYKTLEEINERLERIEEQRGINQ